MKVYYTHRIAPTCFGHCVQSGLPHRYHQHILAWMLIYYADTIRALLESITNILPVF